MPASNTYRCIAALLMLLIPILADAGEERPLAPDISTQQWLNSQPLGMHELRGRVVLVEFWTFGCWNCKNVEPHIKQWHKKYRGKGLVVIGVHTPEFAYERKLDNLRNYVDEHDIHYPVAVDNDAKIWHAFQNWAWPTVYLVDRQGRIRYKRIGEGGYRETEAGIRKLLNESGPDHQTM